MGELVTAKARVRGVWPVGDGQARIELGADYMDGRNAEWAKYTPGLSVTLTIKDTISMAGWTTGDPVTITFQKEDEASRG